MTAEFLVNLGIAQLYFDAEMKRCTPPGGTMQNASQTMHFTRIEADGTLLTKTWDIGLAEFTKAQRARGELYKKSEE